MKNSVARIGLGLAVVGLGLTVGWLGTMSPMSPAANDWAAAAMLSGDHAEALAQYEAIARLNPLTSQRRIALDRGARILHSSTGDRLEAARWYERLAALGGTEAERASALEHAGRAYRSGGRPAAAAVAFHAAWQADPGAESGSIRLLEAARAHAAAGDRKRAMELLDAVGEVVVVGDSVDLTRANLLLESGDLQGALLHYEEAARLATSDGIRSAARDGAESCLERLGNLDEALADFD